MAFRAAFIGIDRYADPAARELSGCKRDALALWALFSDTLPNIDAKLLLDEQATVDAIRRTLDETLGVAGPDDTVVISFSGHGTPDHRLVAHDAARDRLPTTTLDMGELARRFKESRAKVVICVLDCCFSGGAPARVLDDAPAPRSAVFPLRDVAGAGRLLIAASNVNEPALELGRHGLLTRALVAALQADTETVSLPALMDAVMHRVRSDAARLGHVQTPVLFGHVEGGLVMPRLRPGARFYSAFPETRGRRVTGRIEELSSVALPLPLLTAWTEQFPGGLNKLQVQAVNDKGVLDGRSLLVVAPTSSGKTFVGEMAAAKAVAEGRKAVFLFPYKALVNENFDQFTQLYGEKLGHRVIRCTGDFLDQTGGFIRGKYDLAVLTYEMFLNLTLSNPATLDVMGLVVLDEAQFITDPRRGIVVELLLTHLLAARERGVRPQIIALSAVIGDLNHFDEWFGGERLVTPERPVPLVEGVLDRAGVFQYVDRAGNAARAQLLPPHAVVQRKEKASAQDVIVPLVRMLLDRNPEERIIVFRNSRGPAEGCAGYLAKELGLAPATDVVAALPTADPSVSSAALRECLSGGTAFHNANLNPDERVVIERAFRDRNGKVRVLGATTTVAAGINTPASTVILAEQEFVGEDGRPFTVAEYKNMAGRAGRLGYNEEGRSIILAETGTEREQLFRRYVLGKPEDLRSSFDPKDLDTWVLRLLAQVKRVRRSEVVTLLANAYGGYLENRRHPGWREQTAGRLAQFLTQMIELGLVEEEGEVVRLTLLGHACGRSPLRVESSLRLIRMLKSQVGPITADRLLVLIQALPESDATYTPLMKRGQAENRWPREVLRHYGRSVAAELQQHADDHWAYCARCKRAMVVRGYVEGVPMATIERDVTTNAYQGKISAGHVRQFADAARFHLRPAYQIATVLLMTNGPGEDDVESLLRQLEFGIPADSLGLLSLPVQLQRGEYLRLRQHGLTSAEAVWAAPPQALLELLGRDRGAQIERHRPKRAAEIT